jgi:serine/threonine protein kinase
MDDNFKEDQKVEIKVSADQRISDVSAGPGLPAQYEIIEEIGHGGMGTVYKARHKQLGSYVAIKVINASLLEGKDETRENAQKRFINESKAVSKLQHENLISLKDFGVTENGSPFMVMEYAEGKTLEDLIKSGPMEYKAVLSIMRGICNGLEQVHSLGLVHRDIKPSNIIITKSASGREVPKLLDFGIARIIGEEGKTQGLTSTGEVFGSPYSIAPEQNLSSKVDQRADIYSLGCVLFECISGKHPYSGESAMQTIMMHLNAPIPSLSATLGKTLPADLEFIVNRCLQKDPAKRYQSVSKLSADIESLLAGKRLHRTPLTNAPAITKRRGLRAGVAAIVLINLAGITFALLAPHQPRPQVSTAPLVGSSNSSGNSSSSSSMEDAAYSADTGEAFSAFAQRDYKRCIILQKGAIGIYDDRLEALTSEMQKGLSGAALKAALAKQNQLLFWKAENLKHIGDCYRLLNQDEPALTYYQKGLEIFRRWAFTGYHEKDLDECFQYAIEIQKKIGQTADAQNLQLEFDRAMRSRSAK